MKKKEQNQEKILIRNIKLKGIVKQAAMRSRKREDFRRTIQEHGKDILVSSNFKMSDKHIQHGTMSVRKHSIQVAKYSLMINHVMRLKSSQRDLVRGALLHDYFLYDWHDKSHKKITNLHGFYHPGIALSNAASEYELTPREKDIIKKHMWPLTVSPPKCREAWIVTVADKYCSMMETVRLHNGSQGKEIRKRPLSLKMLKK